MVSSTKVNRSTPRKPATTGSFSKKPTKPNQTILNFFKKTEKGEESLFVGAAVTHDDVLYSADGDGRYNEVESPVKKRRLTEEFEETKTAGPKPKGPFVMDSDSEDDEEPDRVNAVIVDRSIPSAVKKESQNDVPLKQEESIEPQEADPPPLKQEDSVDLFQDLDDIDGDLDPDDFEGEERRMMRIMQEQARLEAEEAGISSEDFADEPESSVTSCPICDGSLAGVDADEAARHVNACLDGNPTPLPEPKAEPMEEAEPLDYEEPAEEVESSLVSKRFARAAVPRPGQPNPLEDSKAPKSAFSKLMSGNAEDTAWATAADKEKASRGRPAYERTCPFYKIMPGFNICVDAFRYGAVKDCNAYFLSHFHSDHYIGLTASWRHGPIYCSTVTGSLVKQQLGTAAKWVVQLEFDQPYDVPGTGAKVTMIPANHCPGSSLFLFEKMEKGKVKRILHCGDFRACPEHVRHPLLKPDVMDAGRLRQQKIDICYLDTTYLNPRYSFPPQGDVIRATAELCASISPDPECKDDIWEQAATPAVSKYFKSDKSAAPTKQPRQRLLVICGTYSIGKERICVAIAQALGSKIFASPRKIRICQQLGDPELSALLTSDPLEAQVHMQMLMELRAETLQEYLNSYKPHFSRIVGFRPSGWNFRGNGKITASTQPSSVQTGSLLHGPGWRTRFGLRDFVPQRGSTKEAMCFGVPYSEHSSFRELAMFVTSLRIERVIPTVNVGSEVSRRRMKGWLDRWMSERRRGGLVRPLVEGEEEEGMWDGKNGKGGAAWW